MRKGSIWNLEAKTGDSLLWKAIVKVASSFRDGFKMKVGRGDTSFSYENWLPEGKLCDLVLFVHISDTDLHVGDVYDHGWCHFETLAINLPLELVNAICSIPMAEGYDLDDVGVCFEDISGKYSVKSTYH